MEERRGGGLICVDQTDRQSAPPHRPADVTATLFCIITVYYFTTLFILTSGPRSVTADRPRLKTTILTAIVKHLNTLTDFSGEKKILTL